MTEIWRDIPGYEGQYQVSDLGNVRSLDRFITAKASSRAFAHMRFYAGKMLRPGPTGKHGHLTVALGKGNSVYVHLAVLLAFVGPVPEGQEGRHLNTLTSDNRLANLAYGTRSENNMDLHRNGRRRRDWNPETSRLA